MRVTNPTQTRRNNTMPTAKQAAITMALALLAVAVASRFAPLGSVVYGK